MRRGVGISSLERHTATAASFDTLSSSLSAGQVVALQSQLATFQSSLKAFATKHASSIRSDPAFRTAFSTMCAELGVDPLGGGRKGFWDHVGVGEWTYELAVQVVDVCLRNKDLNGGLMEMEEVLKGVRALREGPSARRASPADVTTSRGRNRSELSGAVTEADVARALKALEPLGCGYAIITLGNRKMVRSVPSEFDTDSLSVLEAASGRGYATHADVSSRTGWSPARVREAIDRAMLGDGLLWVDSQAEDGADRFYVRILGRRTSACS